MTTIAYAPVAAYGGCSGSTAYGWGGQAFAQPATGFTGQTAFAGGGYNINGTLYAATGQVDASGNMVLAAVQAPQQQATTPAAGSSATTGIGGRLPGASEPSEPKAGNYPPGSVWRADENGVLRPFRPDGKKD